LALETPFEAHDYARDYVNNGIPGGPAFDEMMDKYMFRCADANLYFCERRKLPYVKGAAIYEGEGKTYLVIPEYFRSSETKGYMAECAGFTNVELAIRTVEVEA
ncbi:MAG TPA: hypothetical protein VN540_05445, partial [Clostridia bacterium]|nr:hypothetical protein [Clostridia bacterium]